MHGHRARRRFLAKRRRTDDRHYGPQRRHRKTSIPRRNRGHAEPAPLIIAWKTVAVADMLCTYPARVATIDSLGQPAWDSTDYSRDFTWLGICREG